MKIQHSLPEFHLPRELTHPSSKNIEAGDVPGWVLVTLMTAGLVTVVWALADQALRNWFAEAISSVVSP
ncbi:hypothetical protein NXS08_00565 [Gleimia sp. 6138-11-ORH1]|uniref:hypothetical protein n=1 Tax=Gleimia sp. 6138-11-ORH1 TaxID=2973937 RepID=UPI0021672483|nr:hypothetical protein [Gleimia sp. 6138-11-ORH1]MCS4483985.1 hypothetical protein [Gleimia sp. 6138-11-ORH1]